MERAVARGGWTAYGAERALFSTTSITAAEPLGARLLDATIDFLRARNVTPAMVTGAEWRYWLNERGGHKEPWAVRESPPSPTAHDLRPLDAGEVRHLVTLTAAPTSNRFLVRQDGPAAFAWVVEAPWDTDDPRRVQNDQASAQSLWGAYALIGDTLQWSPFWASDDFTPFVGCRPMDLS